MLSVAGDWVDDDEGVAESAILRDVTPGRVGPAAAAPLVVVGGGWLEGLVVIGTQYKYSPVLQEEKIFGTVGEGRGSESRHRCDRHDINCLLEFSFLINTLKM